MTASSRKPDAGTFKPGYEGERLPTQLTLPERQQLRQNKHPLIRRLHDAMLTMSVLQGDGPAGRTTAADVPQHIIEFSDRVGEEEAPAPKARFRPTAAQVDDMAPALGLLEGLTKRHFKVLHLRARHDFAEQNGEQGDWPWEKIGEACGLSGAWAESAYNAALVQAARRCGMLPKAAADYAVLAVSVFVHHAWLTHLSSCADPRQAVANMRGKSPIRIEQATAVWVAGQPVAKNILLAMKPTHRGLLSHGSWFRIQPDRMCGDIIDQAQRIGSSWQVEDISLGPAPDLVTATEVFEGVS